MKLKETFVSFEFYIAVVVFQTDSCIPLHSSFPEDKETHSRVILFSFQRKELGAGDLVSSFELFVSVSTFHKLHLTFFHGTAVKRRDKKGKMSGRPVKFPYLFCGFFPS